MTAWLAPLATLLLGLLTGGMLLIHVALVPFWISLEPLAFSAWFAAHSPKIAALMVPLGVAATLATLVAAVVALVGRRTGARELVLAGAAAVFVGASYPLYYAAANEALASGALSAGEVTAELGRWRAWHLARTLAGGLAFALALRASATGGGRKPDAADSAG